MVDLDTYTLESRLQTYIDYMDSNVERSEKDGYGVKANEEMIHAIDNNISYNRQILIPSEYAFHDLSLSTLRKLPHYLIDSIIKPSAAVPTTLDHFRYWAWTAAIAGKMKEAQKGEFETSHFRHTVHLGLLPIRITQPSRNPTIESILWNSERLTLLSSLVGLESFICNYCDSLTAEGNSRTKITQTWRSEYSDGSYPTIGNGCENLTYRDFLQIWRTCDSKDPVSNVLGEINDMMEYEKEELEKKFEDCVESIEREYTDKTYNFFSLIGDIRNSNLHGEKTTRNMSSIVLTLCCLFIWDQIDKSEYQKLSDGLIDQINSRRQNQSGTLHPLWASSFYPV